MTKYLLSTICLILLIFWPTQAQEIVLPLANGSTMVTLAPERFNTISETTYLHQLAQRGFKLDTQGLLIEALDGSAVYADFQSDSVFNPASVIKIATSFAALAKFGPGYRFETAFYTDGVLNKKTRTLDGNLILHTTGDPSLSATDMTRLVSQVVRSGIARVTGNLIVSGPFSFGNYYTAEQAMKRLATTMRRIGLRIGGAKRQGTLQGAPLVTHVSASLRDILFFQNAHSINPIAERLGEALGGPKAVELFLVEQVGIPQAEIYVGRTSGLEYNRITPRGTVQLLRKLTQWLNVNNMYPEDILPVAGLDPGTLHTRFSSIDYRGAIVAKTGTLPATDGGVSTLAGILYTRDRGPILFAIFNTKGSVTRYRKLQDNFLKSFILECGGIPLINASSRRSNN